MKFLYVGDVPTTLAAGRPVAPGERLNLSKAEVEANAHLTDAGLLVASTERPDKPTAPEKTDSGKEGAAE